MSHGLYRFPSQLIVLINTSKLYKWEISRVENDFELTRGPECAKTEIDAWTIKERFLAIRSVEEAKTFLEIFGQFGPISVPNEADLNRLKPTIGLFDFVPDVRELSKYSNRVRFSDLVLAQSVVRAFAVAKLSEWFALLKSYEVSFKKKKRPAEVLMARSLCISTNLSVVGGVHEGKTAVTTICESAMQSLAAVLQLEKHSGSEYRYCERRDCAEIYKVESGHKRKFCSERCAHLVAVRNSRKRISVRSKRR